MKEDDLTKDALLIIGGSYEQEPLIRKAQQMGYRTVVIDWDEQAPGYKIADVARRVSTTDAAGAIALGKEFNIIGVLTNASETAIVTIAKVAEALGLPGTTIEVAERTTDKELMKLAFQKYYLPTAPFSVVRTEVEALVAAEKHGFPCIIKPADSAGSRGVLKMDAITEVPAASAYALNCSKKKKCLVEEFIDGIELSADSLSYQGYTEVLAISDKEKAISGKNQVAMNIVYPPRFPPEEVAIAKKLITDAVHAVGITDGPAHTEIMRRGKNDFVIIEMGSRGGGFFTFSKVVPAISGIDTLEQLILLAVGKPITITPCANNAAVLRFTTGVPEKIVKMGDDAKARSLQGVLDAGYFMKIGDRVKPIEKDGDRVGYMILTAPTREQVTVLSDKVYDLLQVETIPDIRVADRLAHVRPSASMRANDRAQALKKQGVDVLNLTIGQPDVPTVAAAKKAGIHAIENNISGYMPARGTPELLTAIAEKLKRENAISATVNNIIVVPGTKQAIFYLNSIIINAGDTAIIFEPYWVTYEDSLRICGGTPIFVTGTLKTHFKPSVPAVEQAILPSTKYILFSNPCNPSGALWSKEELIELVQLARRKGVLLIVDEVYEKIVFDQRALVSVASLPGAQDIVITLNGYSKGPAMPGWRIGFVVAAEKIIDALAIMQETIATCASSTSQHAAVFGFADPAAFMAMCATYQRRRDMVVAALNTIKGFFCFSPQGAFYVFPSIEGLGMRSEEATADMLDRAHVAVVPGIAFGKSFDGHVRMSLAASDDVLDRAMERLRKTYGRR